MKIITETTTTYKAPFKGAPRRMNKDTAYKDWARYIRSSAPCRNGECYMATIDEPDDWDCCERHDPAKYEILIERLIRILKYQCSKEVSPAMKALDEYFEENEPVKVVVWGDGACLKDLSVRK